ncbi:MAG: ATP phosphoribosyltransferase regulatory subunit [Natronincolaceae bacterium]|jgi:ATP phosphoribosyltransferase regulatory subunit|nr:ATP phosphoribosyltransferase regulatory subunit [Bacillota bacterium]NLK90873.1 ATP phosphoribosyltransferase regulatory subunit [Clostridiales bacterium]
MKLRKVLLPEGVQDLLIDDCIYRRQIEDKFMENFKQSGYMEVSSPALEYYDLFSRDYLANNGDNTFKLIDTDGKILVLRPDCTVPIVRILSTKMKDFVFPLRLCYVQDVFRIDEEQAGKKREFRQAGVELFGIDSYKADVEVIIIAIESLKHLGLENFQIDIGQTKLLRGILETMGVEEEIKQLIVQNMEDKNLVALNNLIEQLSIEEDIKSTLKQLPKLFGDPEEVLGEINSLPLTPSMKEAVEELEMICKKVEEYGLREYIKLDLGMITTLKYYSGVIFKGFTKDLGKVLLSGGRYDELLRDFDMDIPATGFAFSVNKVTKALKIQRNLEVQDKKHILLLEDENSGATSDVLNALRQKGYIAEVNLLENKKDLKEYIKRRKIDEIIKVDENANINTVGDLEGI